MTEQNQNPEVTEDAEDTEGHGLRHGVRGDMEHTEDTEHTKDDDDAEGHTFRHG